jgi:hypothetical protein
LKGSRPGVGNLDQVGARRLGAHSCAARHHVRVGVGEHDDLAGLDRHGLPAIEACEAATRCYDVISDQVIGPGQDSRQDQLTRRRMDRPGVLCGDVEIRSASQPHGFQNIRQGVSRHFSCSPDFGKSPFRLVAEGGDPFKAAQSPSPGPDGLPSDPDARSCPT